MNAFPTPSPAPHSPSIQTRSDARSAPDSSSVSHSFNPRTAREAAPLRVAGYARVSTDLQRDKDTIATQKDLIEQFCTNNGYTLTEIYADDGVSGTTHLHERPAANQMLLDARAGKFNALVVYKGDRIGRDVLVNEIAVRELFDKLGIAVMGIAEQIDLATPIGRAMFTFQSAIGRLERENTVRRSKDATLRLAKDGVWLGGIVPFGYRVEGKGRDARLRLADEPIDELDISEVDVVRLMYHLSAEEGKSSIDIANVLNEMGIPTAYVRDGRQVIANKRKRSTCGQWTRGRVRNMMVETLYFGNHRWGKKTVRTARKKAALNPGNNQLKEAPAVIERAVPAIVSEELWQAAQVTMLRNSIARPDLTKRKYLLRGIMRCSHCGMTYIGSTRPGKKVDLATPEELSGAEVKDGQILRPYYLCNGHQHLTSTGQKCTSAHLRAPDIEEMLWAQIEGFLREPELVLDELKARLQKQFEGAGALEVEDELEAMRAQRVAIDDQRASLFRFFRRGAMSEADLDRQLAEMVEEESVLSKDIERLEREVARARDANAMLRGARTLLEKLARRLDASIAREPIVLPAPEPSWEVRRRIVEELVLGVEIACQIDPNGLRGQNFTSTLLVTYIFEPRELDAIRSGQANQTKMAAGLTLQRSHTASPRTQVRKNDWEALVAGVLAQEPELHLNGIIERVQSAHGVKLSRAGVSRIRKGLGLAPDNIHSRAAAARFARKAETAVE
jgi:site-specific DNA recombinase